MKESVRFVYLFVGAVCKPTLLIKVISDTLFTN